MFKNSKITVTFVAVFILLTSIFSLPTSAAASATIAFSTAKPTIGSSVTVRVTVNGGEAMYNTTFELKYDAAVLKYASTDAGTVNAAGAGIIKASPAPAGATKATYSFTFNTLKVGSSNISVSGEAYGVTNDLPFGASATMTVIDKQKSDNANLSKLSLSNGTLSPAFSANRTNYTVKVAKSVTECRVYATAADAAGGAKVNITGKNSLDIGENTRTVTVTAASGKQKTYTIVITRSAEEEVVSSTPEVPVVNPYETTIDGVTHTVATDIAGVTLPKGFTASTAEYNNTTVAVAEDKDKNFTIYYLKNAEGNEYAPYILGADGMTFEKLKYAKFGENTYILADIPEGFEEPEGYYGTNVKIGSFETKAFAKTDSADEDFYYVYCYYDGYRFYRYDSVENVLQREPDFKLVEVGADIEEEASDSFAARFNSLSSNAKVIVIGLALALVAGVILIVFLIIKLILSRNEEYDEDEDIDMMFQADFDDVTVSDGSKTEETADETEE